MKDDLQKHKLLGILVGKTLLFDSNLLPKNEPMGVSFDEICKKMKCDIVKLNLIASELYQNEEIKHHDNLGVNGMSCWHNGKVSYSSNKYKNRYLKDLLSFFKEVIQIVVPVLSLIVAILALTFSTLNTDTKQQLQSMKLSIETIQTELNSQTNKIQNLYETISLSDSLSNKIK